MYLSLDIVYQTSFYQHAIVDHVHYIGQVGPLFPRPPSPSLSLACCSVPPTLHSRHFLCSVNPAPHADDLGHGEQCAQWHVVLLLCRVCHVMMPCACSESLPVFLGSWLAVQVRGLAACTRPRHLRGLYSVLDGCHRPGPHSPLRDTPPFVGVTQDAPHHWDVCGVHSYGCQEYARRRGGYCGSEGRSDIARLRLWCSFQLLRKSSS